MCESRPSGKAAASSKTGREHYVARPRNAVGYDNKELRGKEMQAEGEMSERVQTETYRGVVYPWFIDHMGHMNVQFYTARFDEASWQFLATFGLSPNYLKGNARGLVALEQNAKYFVEVLSGCLLEIRTTLLEQKNKTIRFRHWMYNSETREKLASMELLVAFIDTNLRKTVPLPEFARQKATAMLAAVEQSDS